MGPLRMWKVYLRPEDRPDGRCGPKDPSHWGLYLVDVLDLVGLGTFWSEVDIECRVFLAVEESRAEMEDDGDSNLDSRSL